MVDHRRGAVIEELARDGHDSDAHVLLRPGDVAVMLTVAAARVERRSGMRPMSAR
jgi:hypothetical protein